MLAILRKEINSFFSSPIGYLVIAIFLLLNGLFLWVFKGDFNILDYGFADLSSFFLIAPWILMFLIPAVTMRSFSDEKKQATLELLMTKPISKLNIVLGKYFGALILIIIALLPTLLYVYTVYQLGNPIGNLDIGSTLGSYFGLLFLITTYLVYLLNVCVYLQFRQCLPQSPLNLSLIYQVYIVSSSDNLLNARHSSSCISDLFFALV